MTRLFDEFARLKLSINLTIALGGNRWVNGENKNKMNHILSNNPQFSDRFNNLSDAELIAYQ